MHYPMFDEQARSRSIPGRLRSDLREQSDRTTSFNLFTLVDVGQGTPDIYFLADEIVAAKPDIVLLTFNPAYTGDAWRTVVSHPEVSGWLGFSRLFHALVLPLERVGVTIDRLLMYNAFVTLGATEPWRWVRAQQARVGAAWEWADLRMYGLLYSPDQLEVQHAERISSLRRENTLRGPGWGLQRHYGAILDGVETSNPILRLLASTVQRLTSRGITTVVFMLPLNVELLDDLGILDSDGLAHSVQSLREVVHGSGGLFWDLHQLLPAEGFRDAQGHFGYDKGVDGPLLIATELGRQIRIAVSSSLPAPD